MKKHAQLFIVIASVFSLSCFAQQNELIPADARMKVIYNASPNPDLVVVGYHVEERINNPMGTSITSYNVSSFSLVGTNDLGENNVRIVTPKYGKSKAVLVEKVASSPIKFIKNEAEIKVPAQAMPPMAMSQGMMKPIDVADSDEAMPTINAPKEKNAKIDILATYERIMDKGYKTVDMVIKVGNGHFFAGDLVLAAKWYDELFAMKTDLEPVYYYRYAQSLMAVKQFAKANAMMKIFETKNL